MNFNAAFNAILRELPINSENIRIIVSAEYDADDDHQTVTRTRKILSKSATAYRKELSDLEAKMREAIAVNERTIERIEERLQKDNV